MMKPTSRHTRKLSWLTALQTLALVFWLIGLPISKNTPALLAQPAHFEPSTLVLDLLSPDSDPVYQQALLLFHGIDLTGKDGPLAKIGFDLTLLSSEYQAYLNTAGNPALFHSEIPLVRITNYP